MVLLLDKTLARLFKNAKKAFNHAATAENDKRAEKLEEARKQIDIATDGIDQFDEKTLPKVWLKSGEIYMDLAKTDFTMMNLQGAGYSPKYPNASSKAYEAYEAALKLPNLKKYNKSTALDGLSTLWTFLANEGNISFNEQEYKKAYEAFSQVINIDNLLVQNSKNSIFDTEEKKKRQFIWFRLKCLCRRNVC